MILLTSLRFAFGTTAILYGLLLVAGLSVGNANIAIPASLYSLSLIVGAFWIHRVIKRNVHLS